jgi:hypothetical protein
MRFHQIYVIVGFVRIFITAGATVLSVLTGIIIILCIL